jgi:hypothetical protein
MKKTLWMARPNFGLSVELIKLDLCGWPSWAAAVTELLVAHLLIVVKALRTIHMFAHWVNVRNILKRRLLPSPALSLS